MQVFSLKLVPPYISEITPPLNLIRILFNFLLKEILKKLFLFRKKLFDDLIVRGTTQTAAVYGGPPHLHSGPAPHSHGGDGPEVRFRGFKISYL